MKHAIRPHEQAWKNVRVRFRCHHCREEYESDVPEAEMSNAILLYLRNSQWVHQFLNDCPACGRRVVLAGVVDVDGRSIFDPRLWITKEIERLRALTVL